MPTQNFVKTMKQLRDKNDPLTYLSISYKLSPAQMDELAKVLLDNTTLELLDFGDNEIGDEGAQAIARFLAYNKSIKALNLRANKIGPEGAKAIAKALETNTSLESLDIEANEIGPEGAQAIAKALEKNNNLKELFIKETNSGPEGAQAIAKALEKNTSLGFLKTDTSEDEIGPENAEAIARVLDKNRIPRAIHINNANMPPIEAEIQRRLDRNNVLHPSVVSFFKAPPFEYYFSVLPLNVRDMLPDYLVCEEGFSQLHCSDEGASQADVQIMDSISPPRPTC